MKVTIRIPASPHGVFAVGAFDLSIGKEISVDVDGQRHRGTLLGAEVVSDGAAVLVTLETDFDLTRETSGRVRLVT